LVIFVRRRTVANVDAMGFVVRCDHQDGCLSASRTWCGGVTWRHFGSRVEDFADLLRGEEDALADRLTPTHVTHVLYLTRTARAHLQLGDLDAACAAAADAFAQNATLNSSRPSDALDDLRDDLASHRDVRAVRDFLLLSA